MYHGFCRHTRYTIPMITLQVGVKVFLKNSEGKYLLLKRNMQKYKGAKGSWDIVGGRIEPGTPLVENLKREIREETQLEFVSEPRLIYAQDILHFPEKHVVRLTYLADLAHDASEPILDMSENLEYRWLSVKEMKKQQDMDIYVKEVLEKGLLR
jgi:ADP-ribose pyrophosphatase YjhB (NUDIX family)